ncbi:MAG TPA: glycosyltransferase family 1 protein [Pyrinomonadaceae bacterium]|nr:glycosyltransferase family 1 protein [Pyrinomonadaceae bacterium]
MNLATAPPEAILPHKVFANPGQTATKEQRTRVAILCDFAEENWPSMDLVGEMLAMHLDRNSFSAHKLSPPFQRRFTRLSSANQPFNADRVFNRFWDYQRWLRPQLADFDLFHVVDHSYSQLVHGLPPARSIVSCHDLDAFRCLIEPAVEPRPLLFRKMMERVLSGLQKAERVTCDSAAIRDELLAHKLVEPDRIRVIPLGVHPTCSPEADAIADAEAAELVRANSNAIDLLHVGSTIRRKRIDVLLKVFANVRREIPTARLLRVGGAFTDEQLHLVDRLALKNSIVVLPRVSREVLAAIYRHAALVLQPSDAEGFGLPVIEAMACGTPVVASDLPVLREVGGEAAAYAAVANTDAWSHTVSSLLTERVQDSAKWSSRCDAGLVHANEFTWWKFATRTAEMYRELLA